MKRSLLPLALLISVTAIAGCAGGNGNVSETTALEETTEAVTTAFSVEEDPNEKSMYDEDFDFDDYLTLGDYRNLSVKVPAPKEITDESIENELARRLVAGEYFKRDDSLVIVRVGDVVSLDFESRINGEEYSGGDRNDFCLAVGANGFIPALEAALVGRSVGETFTISATYPADYGTETLAGKTADFTVKINYIGVPDPLTDQMAAALSGDEEMTAAGYMAALRAVTEAAARVEYRTALYDAVWNVLSADTEVRTVPVCDRVDYCDEVIAFYTAYAENLGYTYAGFLEAQGYTENLFFSYLYQDISYHAVSQRLVLNAVCAREGLPRTMTEEEYAAGMTDYLIANGHASLSEMDSIYGEYSLKSMAFFNYVMEHIAQIATVVTE